MDSEAKQEITTLIPKFVFFGGLILLLTYGKMLWPLMYGYMRETNASFIEALSQFHLHGIAFIGLLIAIIVGYLWSRARFVNNGV